MWTMIKAKCNPRDAHSCACTLGEVGSGAPLSGGQTCSDPCQDPGAGGEKVVLGFPRNLGSECGTVHAMQLLRGVCPPRPLQPHSGLHPLLPCSSLGWPQPPESRQTHSRCAPGVQALEAHGKRHNHHHLKSFGLRLLSICSMPSTIACSVFLLLVLISLYDILQIGNEAQRGRECCRSLQSWDGGSTESCKCFRIPAYTVARPPYTP